MDKLTNKQINNLIILQRNYRTLKTKIDNINTILYSYNKHLSSVSSVALFLKLISRYARIYITCDFRHKVSTRISGFGSKWVLI